MVQPRMPRRQPTPFEAAITSQGMFEGAREPMMHNPMNFGGMMGGGMTGVASQMIMPMIAQGFMGQYGQVPSQFLPTQNLFDQFQSQRYHAQQQQAMSMASQRDQLAMSKTMIGGLRMMQGTNPTIQQQQQAFGTAGQLTSMLPTLSMFLGPETIDAMFGSRGSAMLMGQSMHRGSRMSRDPVTGGLGFSGRSAGNVASEVYEQLFGEGADLTDMRGLSAGGAGQLFEQLQMRGMAGPSLGAMSPEERMRVLSRTNFTQQEQVRTAEASIRARGQDVNAGTIEAARKRIFDGPQSTMGRIQRAEGRPGGIAGMSPADLDRLRNEEGGDELLTTAQAQRITGRLKNLAGAVSAMRDIFGDMGRPDAPMREIINGLEALTQGGLSTMSPGRVEQMVRTTKNLAQQSGLGIGGMVGLQGQAADMADKLGLDRSLAVQATQGAAAFAGAARDTMRLDKPSFGGLTAEQATLLDQQLRLTAQASQTGNVLNASIRMLDEGAVDANSDAGRLATAVKQGKSTFVTQAGETKSVHMTNAEWVDLQKKSGVAAGAAESVISDTFMNQQYGRDNNTGELARRLQREVDIEPRVGNTFANALAAQFQQGGMQDVLRAQGLNDDQISTATQQMSGRLAQRFFQMDAESSTTAKGRNQFMANALQEVIEQDIRARGAAAGTPQAEIDKQVAAAKANMTDDQARQAAMAMMGQMGNRITQDPQMQGFRSVRGLWQMNNAVTMEQQQGRMTDATTQARMQSAFSRLGRAGPIRRLVDEMQRGTTDPFGKVLGRVLGGIDENVLQELEKGPLGALRGLQQEFGAAERHTEASALRTVAEEEAARRKGKSLEDYRKDVDQATRDKEVGALEKDDAFRKTVDTQVRARTGNLTARGVQQRDLMSQMVEAMMEGGKSAETAKSQLAEYLGTDVAGIKQNLEGRLAAKDLPAGQRRRLERFQAAFTAISAGQVVPDILRKLGVAEGQQITAGEVAGLGELGTDTQKRLAGLKPPAAGADKATQERFAKDKQAAQDAAGRFLQRTRDLGDSLLASTKDMEQLGRGGMERLNNMRATQSKLDKLASDAGVTPAELLAGKGTPEQVSQARKLMGEVTDQWAEIGKIKDTGVMPGVGTRAKDQKLGEREKAVIEKTSAFTIGQEFARSLDPKSFKTEEERLGLIKQAQAAAVTKQLADEMGGAMRGKIVDEKGQVTAAGQTLMKKIQEGGRSTGIFQALEARKQLAAMKEKGEDMTSAEAKQLQKLAAPLEGLKKDDELGDLTKRIEKFSGVGRETGAPGAAGAPKVAMTMTGNLELTADGRAKIQGEGHGDLAHNDVWSNLLGGIKQGLGVA